MMKGVGISMRTKILPILLLAAVAGCSTSNSERTDYKNDAAKAAVLEVPPDLVPPKSEDRYTVPDGGGGTVTSYSEYARSNAQNQACTCKEATAAPASSVPPAPHAAAVAAQPPKLKDRPDGSKSILIGEPFDRCWLSVGEALDRAGIAVEDKDRSKGLLYLKGGKNQITVKADATGCEVAADNGSGASSDETKRTIDALYKKLGG
jgi:uncharacterized lipoprotein